MSSITHQQSYLSTKPKSYSKRGFLNPNKIEGLFSIILGLAIILLPSANTYNNAFLGLLAGFCVIWTGLHLILENRVSPFAFGFSITVRAVHATAVIYDIFQVWNTARLVLAVLVFGSVFISLAWKLSQKD